MTVSDPFTDIKEIANEQKLLSCFCVKGDVIVAKGQLL
jgi:hypothetical protein